MKITRVHLKDFHQFKDVNIDLTYPLGHPKAGEPLDKVCIIGQSGTGKTTLLKIIGGHTFNVDSLFREYLVDDFKNVSVDKKFNGIEARIKVGYVSETNRNTYLWEKATQNGQNVSFDEIYPKQTEFLSNIKTHFINFPSDLHYEFETSGNNLSNKRMIDFTQDKVGDIWNFVLEVINKFYIEGFELENQITKIVLENSFDTIAINAAIKKLEDWKKTAINPINKLADECLDPVLKYINLRVKRDFQFESRGDARIVKLEDLNGNEVPYHLLSTGTKQILLTALPLYLLKPDETLILCDEPERSLYPNMQKFIVDFYTSLTKNSQFIFATHSPIIASTFEPWEVVELKFNDEGFVYQELYYPKNKERHVDNYYIYPSYLTYDLMLSKVFDLAETYSNERADKITEVLMLRGELQKRKENGEVESAETQEIYARYRSLAEKLFWDFDIQPAK